MKKRTPLLAAILALAAAAPARASVVTIVMENREASSVLGNRAAPYANRLARRYAVATASYGITHPSLPNYIALISGSTVVRSRSIVDQLEEAGLTWKAYMEGLPRPCFKGAARGGYVKRHNPFMYFARVADDPGRCRRVVPLSRLGTDLPDYAFISPGLCHDGHDCDTATADRFLARLVPRLLPRLGPRGFLIVTWDECTSSRGCCGGARGGRIPTIVAGPRARRGARLRTPVDHYGVLRTVEDVLGLPRLGRAAEPGHGSLSSLLKP
jgi:hypothetical protein